MTGLNGMTGAKNKQPGRYYLKDGIAPSGRKIQGWFLAGALHFLHHRSLLRFFIFLKDGILEGRTISGQPPAS